MHKFENQIRNLKEIRLKFHNIYGKNNMLNTYTAPSDENQFSNFIDQVLNSDYRPENFLNEESLVLKLLKERFPNSNLTIYITPVAESGYYDTTKLDVFALKNGINLE